MNASTKYRYLRQFSNRIEDFDEYGREMTFKPMVCWDKTVPIRHFLHYSDPQANQVLDVFGRQSPNLFYNYDDRLIGEEWNAGVKLAVEKGLTPFSVLWYECILNRFHGSTDVNIGHIQLGCNRSNGYSYLVFGYTYTT